MGAFLICLGLIPFMVVISAIFSPKRGWGRRLLPSTAAPALPYRASAVVRWKDAKEPRVVRVTSAVTGFLGGMLFPGGMVGLIGIVAALTVLSKGTFDADSLLIAALGASVPTGLVLAFRNLVIYGAIIENRAGITRDMRRLANFTIAQNLCVVGVVAAYTMATWEPFALIPGAYNAISFLHAWLLHRSADVIDVENARAAQTEQVLQDTEGRAMLSLDAG